MSKNNQLFSISCIILLSCVYTYMMFWENRYINSGVLFFLIAVLSLLTLFISSEVYLEKQEAVFFILTIYNIVQLSFMKIITNDAIKWTETLIIYTIILIAFINSFQKNGVSSNAIKIPLTVLSGIFVFGIYLQKLSPIFVSRINSMFLNPVSIINNRVFLTWGYYCGFTGLTVVSGLTCMVFGILQLDRAMSKNLKKANRILCFACVLMAIYGTILIQKRGLFISTLVCIAVYILLKTENRKSLLTSIVLIGFIGVVCYYFLYSNESGALFLWRSFEKEDLTSGRAVMWSDLIEKSKDVLITGYGPASVTTLYGGDAHNIYLQVLYENGIIGLSLYLIFFGLNLVASYKCIKSGNNMARIGFAVQIGILVYGFTGNPLTDIFVFLLYLLASTIGYLQTSSTICQGNKKPIEYKYVKNGLGDKRWKKSA